MIIELDRRGLMCLVEGIVPNYEHIEYLTNRELGYWCGGFVDQWRWESPRLARLTEEELYELYLKLRS